jgi:hypothetical protein
MLLIIGIGALVVTVLASYLRPGRGVDAAPLGWMSEQWLAEHRAMHPS